MVGIIVMVTTIMVIVNSVLDITTIKGIVTIMEDVIVQ